jgi:hypothetical protein
MTAEKFLEQDVEVTLKVAELIDLIEIGAIAQQTSGWEFPIVDELRELFTKLAEDLALAADEV